MWVECSILHYFWSKDEIKILHSPVTESLVRDLWYHHQVEGTKSLHLKTVPQLTTWNILDDTGTHISMGMIEHYLGEKQLGCELEDHIRRHLDDHFAAVQEQLLNEMKPGVSYDIWFCFRHLLTTAKDQHVNQ